MTFEEAVDDILAMTTEALVPSGFKIFYEGVADDRDTSNDPFFRVYVRHLTSGQRTLGGTGHRMFGRNGILTVQIYIPIANGLQESYQLGKVVIDAFEGKSSPNGVWFRRTRINEVGKDGMFHLTNAIVDFEYHETK